MKFAVVGAGAVGGYCVARLCNAGHQVSVVEVGPHLQAIKSHGLRVQPKNAQEWVVHPLATDNPEELEVADCIIISVQSQDTSAIAEGIKPFTSAHTLIIPLQNNVDNPKRLALAVGQANILPAAIFIAASRPEPGLVKQLSEQVRIYLGELDPQVSERVMRMAKILSDSGLPCVACENVWKEIWTKYSFVIGFYLTSPLLCSAGEILDLEETRLLHFHLVNEVAAVAASQGVILDEKVIQGVIKDTRHYGDYIPSSVQEMQEGRADEYVHMLESLIQLGKSAEISTPMAEATLAFTKFFNNRNKKITGAVK